MNKTFSVILPIYNVEKYIEQCLKSILEQTFTDFEVLCIDDCGQDNAMSIVEQYAANDDRIKILRHSQNESLGSARNTGLSQACGKYICCVDSDDFIESNFLEKVYEVVCENPDVDSVWTKFWLYDEEADYARLERAYPYLNHHQGGVLDISAQNINDYPAYAWNKVYKSDFIKQHSFYWAEKVCFEDMFFYYNYFMTYSKVYLINDFLYYYRLNKDSLSRNVKLKQIKDMYTVFDMILDSIKEKQTDIAFVEALKSFENNFQKNLKQYETIYPMVSLFHNKFLAKTSRF